MSKANAIARLKMNPMAASITAEVDRAAEHGMAIGWGISANRMTGGGILDPKNPEPLTHYEVTIDNGGHMEISFDVPAEDVADMQELVNFYYDDLIEDIKSRVAAKKAQG